MAGVAPLLPRTDAEARWFAAVSFTAGICEEILYRGFLFAWAMGWAGPWPAMLVHVVLDLTSGSLGRRALALSPGPEAAPA